MVSGALVGMLFLGLFMFVSPIRAFANTQAVLAEVSRLVSQREFNAAIELFDEIDESTSEIRLLMASVLNSAGRTSDARAIACEIASGDPANSDALMVLAAAALVEGNFREQRGFLERVIAAEPGNIRALCELGYNSLRTRALGRAGEYFDTALGIDGNNPEALVGRAIVHVYNRNSASAERLLNHAIEQNPDWTAAYQERAQLFKSGGFLEDALADLDRARELEPDNHWIMIDHAIILAEMGFRPQALEELDEAILLSPDNFVAHVHRAGIREASGDLEGAARDHQTVMRIRPDYFFAAEGLGIIRMMEGRHVEARDAFLAAHRQAPKEYRYALLAAANWIRASGPADPRQFIAQVIRTAKSDSPEWTLLRLYHDFSGEAAVSVRIQREQNLEAKAMMLFYLALYHDIRGNAAISGELSMQLREMGRRGMVEWNLNEWMIESREQSD